MGISPYDDGFRGYFKCIVTFGAGYIAWVLIRVIIKPDIAGGRLLLFGDDAQVEAVYFLKVGIEETGRRAIGCVGYQYCVWVQGKKTRQPLGIDRFGNDRWF
jgi:hypothetical protein